MAYVSDSNLTQFWGLAKDYINAEDGRFANWQKTEKAGAVTCYPVGETPLLPTVDFMFTEVPPASGDKGPENPSTITGVSSVKVTRANSNLIRWPYYHPSGYEKSDVTWTINNDGSVSATGTSDGVSTFALQDTNNIQQSGIFLQPGTYKLSGCPAGGSYSKYGLHLVFSSADSDKISYTSDYGDGATITVISPLKICFYLRIASGNTVSNLTFYPALQLVEAPFEKNEQDIYTIDLDGTYYGGEIDLATGLMTVTHAAVTPDASTVDISSAPAALPLDYADTYGRTITSADGTSLVVGSTGGTVVYKLATPQTVQLTPLQLTALAQKDKYTPRMNTVYTDASAVQVGYAKSPIRSEYELTQAIIATEGGE